MLERVEYNVCVCINLQHNLRALETGAGGNETAHSVHIRFVILCKFAVGENMVADRSRAYLIGRDVRNTGQKHEPCTRIPMGMN